VLLPHLSLRRPRPPPRPLPLRAALRTLGNVAHLAGEVRRHEVHVVGQIPPRTRHTTYLSLATELALGTHLTGHPSHLIGKRRQQIGRPHDCTPDTRKPRMPAHRGLLRQI